MSGDAPSIRLSRFASWAMAAGVLVPATALYVSTVPRDLVLAADAAEYIHLADNLLARGAYCSNAGPYGVVPPGFPLFLAGFFGLFGHHWVALNIVMAMMAVAALAGFFVYAWRVALLPIAACLTLAFALCLPFFWVSRHVLTDIPFVCVLIAFAYATKRWQEADQSRAWLVAAILLAALGVFIRSVGLVLAIVLAGLFVAQRILVHRRPVGRALVGASCAGIMAATPMILFVARNAMLDDGEMRGPPFARMADLTFGSDASIAPFLAEKSLTLRLCVRGLLADATNVDLFRSISGSWMAVAVAVLLLPGGWILLCKRRDPLAWLLVAYLPIIVVMPPLSWHTQWRYLMPVLPAAILCIWQSLDWWCERVRTLMPRGPSARPFVAWLPGVLVVGVSVASGFSEWRAEVASFVQSDTSVHRKLAAAREAADWVDRSLPSDARILSAGYAPFLLTGRMGALLPALPDGAALVEYARQHDVRWVVSWKPSAPHEAVADALAKHRECTIKRFENDIWMVCELHAGARRLAEAG